MTRSIKSLLSSIRQLVEMESYTHDLEAKEKLATFIAQNYQSQGFAVERVPVKDETAHVIARAPWGQDRDNILLLSHLDTVHPTGTLDSFPFSIDEKHAHGPGILDMKTGFHLAFDVLCEIAKSPSKDGTLGVTHLIVTDEESGSKSSRQIIAEEARKAKYVLVTEPAGKPGAITTSRKGSLRYRLDIKGVAAHSGSNHERGRSAILEAAHQILSIEALTDYPAGITANCGTISGGTGVNTIPEHCHIDVDIRMPTNQAAEHARLAIENLEPKLPDVSIATTGGVNRPPFERRPEADILINTIKNHAADIGIQLEEFSSGSGSDANLTADLAPTVCGIAVEGTGAHTLNEQIDITSLLPRRELLLRTLLSLT